MLGKKRAPNPSADMSNSTKAGMMATPWSRGSRGVVMETRHLTRESVTGQPPLKDGMSNRLATKKRMRSNYGSRSGLFSTNCTFHLGCPGMRQPPLQCNGITSRQGHLIAEYNQQCCAFRSSSPSRDIRDHITWSMNCSATYSRKPFKQRFPIHGYHSSSNFINQI